MYWGAEQHVVGVEIWHIKRELISFLYALKVEVCFTTSFLSAVYPHMQWTLFHDRGHLFIYCVLSVYLSRLADSCVCSREPLRFIYITKFLGVTVLWNHVLNVSEKKTQ